MDSITLEGPQANSPTWASTIISGLLCRSLLPTIFKWRWLWLQVSVHSACVVSTPNGSSNLWLQFLFVWIPQSTSQENGFWMLSSAKAVVLVSRCNNWRCPSSYRCIYGLNAAFLHHLESKSCIELHFRSVFHCKGGLSLNVWLVVFIPLVRY